MSVSVFVITVNLMMLLPVPVRAQTNSLINVQVVVPGMTETVIVKQEGFFPMGAPHFFITVLGTGTLGLSLRKADQSGDLLFMVGRVISEAGSFPISRVGMSEGVIDQIVEVGDADKPFGFVWLYCGVMFSANNPTYTYELRISLAP